MAGVTLNDKKLAAEVRTLALKQIKKYLQSDVEEEQQLKNQLLLRLAPTILPRINEHMGEDGSPIVVQLSQAIADKNGISITHCTGGNSEGQPPIQSNKLRKKVR